MNLQEKATFFMDALKVGDPRCQMLLMMLTISFGISEQECIERIKQLADKK